MNKANAYIKTMENLFQDATKNKTKNPTPTNRPPEGLKNEVEQEKKEPTF